MKELTCYRASCYGVLEYVEQDRTAALYRCQECGEELEKEPLERIQSEDYDDLLTELCEALLNGVGESHG